MFLLYSSRMNSYKSLSLNFSKLTVSMLAIFLIGCSSGLSSEQLQNKIDSGNSSQMPQQQTTQLESPAANSETVSPEAETIPDEPKLTLTISGDNGNTAPFSLNAGIYKVNYTTYKQCYYGAYLESVDGYYEESLFSFLNEVATGETYLYDVKENDYYISVITGGGCKWDVTFTQQ
jgi:hypothetical protein